MEHPVLFSDLCQVPGDYKHVFYTWMAIILLFIVGLFARRKMTMVPTGVQNIMEFVVGGLEDYTIANMGEKGRQVFPYLCGMFLFILFQNWIGLLPGCDAPTANLNTTMAMAVLTFLYYNFVGFKTWGPGYVKHFMGPMLPMAVLIMPIEIISHCARPVSLTLRLFGNIRGEEIVILLFFLVAPIAGTLPVYALFTLAKFIQAFIFYMLTMLYLNGALEHAH